MRISDWSSDVCSSDLFTDVTALKRDSALFNRAQTLAHIGGWEWDTGRNRLYLTQETQHILGQDPPPETIEALIGCLREGDRGRLRKERKSVVSGKSVSVRVDLGGRRIMKKKKK